MCKFQELSEDALCSVAPFHFQEDRLFLHPMSASPSVLLDFRGKLEGFPQRLNIKQTHVCQALVK